jgi:hypothetical protein
MRLLRRTLFRLWVVVFGLWLAFLIGGMLLDPPGPPPVLPHVLVFGLIPAVGVLIVGAAFVWAFGGVRQGIEHLRSSPPLHPPSGRSFLQLAGFLGENRWSAAPFERRQIKS